MKAKEDWDSRGNFIGSQPHYGFDAYGTPVPEENGWDVLPESIVIKDGDEAFDIYAGWIKPDNFHARNKDYTHSAGRWTAWRRKVGKTEPGTPLDCGMPNLVAYKLGLLACKVAALGPDKAGDEIDRGLILVRRLNEMGYDVVPKKMAPSTPPLFKMR